MVSVASTLCATRDGTKSLMGECMSSVGGTMPMSTRNSKEVKTESDQFVIILCACDKRVIGVSAN